MAYKYPYEHEEKETQRAKLATNRNMWKLMFLHILTLGIYGVVFFIPFSFDLDKVHPQFASPKQMNYLGAFIISLFTFGVVLDIWQYQTAKRITEALEYRNIDYEFGTQDFWGWFIFGSLIIVGPFVYYHKLCKAMNLLCEDYNEDPTNSLA